MFTCLSILRALSLSRGPSCRTVTVSSLAAAQVTVPSTHTANMMEMTFSALHLLTELDDNVRMTRTLQVMTLPLARSARTRPSTPLTAQRDSRLRAHTTTFMGGRPTPYMATGS